MLEDLEIIRDKRSPVSRQIVEHIRSQIKSNRLKPGQQLPTAIEIIKRLGIGSHTLSSALARLTEEGLVKSEPGRGAFIAEEPFTAQKIVNGPLKKVMRFALNSAFAHDYRKDTYSPDAYRADSVAGFLEECKSLNIIGSILPEGLVSLPAAQIHKHLTEMKCDGIVWLYPDPKEFSKIEYLQDAGVPVVATRRSHRSDNITCVEANHTRAGFVVGEYFINNGCNKVLIINSYQNSGSSRVKDTNFATGLQDGMNEVFYAKTGETAGKIEIQSVEGHTKKDSRTIKRLFKKTEPDCGVFIGSAYHFYNFVVDEGDEALELLKNRKFMTGTNYIQAAKWGSLVRTLDFPVLLEPFDEVARCAVQKLLNILNGSLVNTTTLVNVELKNFWDIHSNTRIKL